MSKLTQEDLNKLRKKLPHRYARELSRRTHAKPALIWQVMTGRKEDYYGIIKAAAEWVKEIEQEQQYIQNILNKDDDDTNHSKS